MASIHTLIPDIQALLKTKGWMTEALAKELGDAVSRTIAAQFAEEKKTPSLRLSGMGPKCPRALWYSIHAPEEAEDLPPWSQIKFSLGHFQEAYGIVLCKAAGHTVEGEQHECELDGIKGHIDCYIDGCCVDFKSTSRRQFEKFRTGIIPEGDPFSYLEQLDGYVVACRDDDRLLVKDKGYIFAIQKELGHVALYEHDIRPASIRQRIAEYKKVVRYNYPPECECGTINIGASGNVGLDTRASYNAFKWVCKPTLRCFIYSTGPVYLTKVVRVPDVPEVNRFGKRVYLS